MKHSDERKIRALRGAARTGLVKVETGPTIYALARQLAANFFRRFGEPVGRHTVAPGRFDKGHGA